VLGWALNIPVPRLPPVLRASLRIGQVPLFEGAVELEYQRDLDIVLTIGAMGCGQPCVRGYQVANEKQLGADHPTHLKKNSGGVFQLED
jgi:hypothetical protein